MENRLPPAKPPRDLLPMLVGCVQKTISNADRARALRHVLDWVACRAGGSRLHEAACFAAALLGDDDVQAAPAVLQAGCPPLEAVLVDGALGCVLEMDDVHKSAVLHPGPVVIPAALVAARQSGCDLATALDAVVCGYEVMIRLGRALGLGHYRYWHPTSTCGTVGAAVAAAVALGLRQEEMVWAAANAGSRTGGLWQMRHEQVPTKALHTALAAQSGYLAARLAAHGFAGPASLLEGEQGLFAATAPNADHGLLLAEESDWLIHQVSFKPWPACRHAHPAIDALLKIDPLPSTEQIEQIVVQTYQAAIDFCNRTEPQTSGEARFSIQHALASILTRGRPRVKHYDLSALGAEDTAKLRRRIQLAVDPAIHQAFPSHFGARVEIKLRDGQALQASVQDAWGDPEWPLTEADLALKAKDLFDFAGLDAGRSTRIIDRLLGLDDRYSEAAIPLLTEVWT